MTRSYSEDELRKLDTGRSIDDIKVKQDPISYYCSFLEDRNRSTSYINQINTKLIEFDAFLDEECDGIHLCGISENEVRDFSEFLESDRRYFTITEHAKSDRRKEIELSKPSIGDFLANIRSFYNHLIDDGIVSTNPVSTELIAEYDTSSPNRPNITMAEMRSFLEWLKSPLAMALFLLSLKTALRRGECSNIDLCCVNIDHPVSNLILDRHDVELVDEVRDKRDAIYIRPKFQKGTVIDGEKRPLGNKRKRKGGSILPIDDELKKCLIEYLLIRRPTVETHENGNHPLFVKPTIGVKTDRMTGGSFDSLVARTLGEYPPSDEADKWYRSGRRTQNNVTFHHFRHFFTHNHKHPRKGSTDVFIDDFARKYIRGDVHGDDSVEFDHYDHSNWDDWNRLIRDPYLNNVYQFDLY